MCETYPKSRINTAWKVSKYGPEKTPYFDTVHAVNGTKTTSKVFSYQY